MVYGDETIEMVNKFKYLGVSFTPRLTFTDHVFGRAKLAKTTSNSIWNNVMIKNDVNMGEKWRIFRAV